MKVLVPNLGSTSLKYQLLDMRGEQVLARGKIERIGSQEARLQQRHTGVIVWKKPCISPTMAPPSNSWPRCFSD